MSNKKSVKSEPTLLQEVEEEPTVSPVEVETTEEAGEQKEENSVDEQQAKKSFNPYNIWGYNTSSGELISIGTQRKKKREAAIQDLHDSDASLKNVEANINDGGVVSFTFFVEDQKEGEAKEENELVSKLNEPIATKKSLETFKEETNNSINELKEVDETINAKIANIENNYAKTSVLSNYVKANALTDKLSALEKRIQALESKVQTVEP